MLVFLKQGTLSILKVHLAQTFFGFFLCVLWHLRVQFSGRQVQAPLKSAVLACPIFDGTFHLSQLLESES